MEIAGSSASTSSLSSLAAALREQVPARTAIIALHEPSLQRWIGWTDEAGPLDEEDLLTLASRSVLEQARVAAGPLRSRALERARPSRESADRLGLVDVLALPIGRPGSQPPPPPSLRYNGCVYLDRSCGDAPFDGEAIALAEDLTRIIELRLALDLPTSGPFDRPTVTEAVLERFALPVLYLDARGQVIDLTASAADLAVLNAAATVARGRHLEFLDPEADLALRLVLSEFTAGAAGSTVALPMIRVPRPEAAPLDLLPLRLTGPDGPRLALAVFDPDLAAERPAKLLQELFSLTDAEHRVLLQVMRGRSVDGAAEALGISRETVRTHLKRIFGKVGTTRQVNLIRLAFTLATTNQQD